AAVDPARITIKGAFEPDGTFAPLPITNEGGLARVHPSSSGDLFLRVAEEDAPGIGLLMGRIGQEAAAEARLWVGMAPGGTQGPVEVRALPANAEAALRAGFADRSWPWIYSGDDLLRGPAKMKLLPGRYQVRWASGNTSAIVPFDWQGEP